MDNVLFRKQLEKRAAEFGVNPAFLFHAYKCIIDSENEHETLRTYINLVSDRLFSIASHKSNSKNITSQKQAAFSMQKLNQNIIDFIKLPLLGQLSAGNFFDLNKPLKRYQYKAWEMAATDAKIIEDRFGGGMVPKSFLDVIKVVCREDILTVKDFINLLDIEILPN